MKKTVLLFVVSLCIHFGYSQDPTVGLLYHDDAVSDGYVLVTPSRNHEVFLLNTCGERVNQWTFNEVSRSIGFILPNGNLLRAGFDNLEIKDWNNNTVWSYPMTANGLMQHHDIKPLPNGNILCIVEDRYSQAEMTAFGRNPAFTAAEIKFEKIVEIQLVGSYGGIFVWEWKFKDHLIQDFDASKLNYGVVENHPELLHVNFDNGSYDNYIHANGIDYNANLDQILISARHLSEIFIIDHSTTTAEAASHSGGNSGKGGDFLWRFGNPQVNRGGTAADQKLFLQHDPRWVKDGYLDAGKITVFNNGDDNGTQTFSSVHLINTNNGNYTMTGSVFNPINYEWSWSGNLMGSIFDQVRQSGVQSLPNGNLLICEALIGRISEITKAGSLLWSYKNPTGIIPNGGTTTYYNQFDAIPANVNTVFKSEKYPTNYIGFNGHDLTPSGIIENQNSISAACSALGNDEFNQQHLVVANPVKNNLIAFNTSFEADSIHIYDANGRMVHSENEFSGNQITIDLSPSIYFMKIKNKESEKNIKLLVH